uniref:Mitochondrial import inner membrane translocase subunit TIM50 n=1 Tax=Globisporangium ultimum (strain ATCC 200006 / CBS 805.95 / DAOM BR144) TaxID=431595 RepID=K3WYH5_GLOUD
MEDAPETTTPNGVRGSKRAAAPQQQQKGSFSPGGHYADPMSPIASTPLKRQRVNTTAEKSKSAKFTPHTASTGKKQKKQQQRDDASDNAATKNAKAQDDGFLSPRKLVSEYDTTEDKNTDKTSSKQEQSDADMPSEDDPTGVMFSPTLKPPRAVRTTSSSSSPSTTTPDASFLSSSSTCSEKNDDEEDTVAAPATASEHVEAEDDEDAYSYTAGSESGSDASATEQEFNPFYFMKTLPKYEHVVIGPRPVVLPAKSAHAPKISLVLDLDETLVHCSVDDVENPHLQFPVNFNGVEYTVKVKKRPHMEYFLKRASQLFEVVVFTASHRAYAETLLNLIDPHRNLINNGIPIETWYDDEADDELLNLLPFLESLVDVDDVRPIVEKQFQIQKLIDATPDDTI